MLLTSKRVGLVALAWVGSLACAAGPTVPAGLTGGAAQQPSSLLGTLFPLFLMGVIVAFFFWSQRRRTQQMNKLLSSLSEGDEVALSNGLMGKVVKVGTQSVTVELAEGVHVKAQRNAVLQALPKGTLDLV